MTVRARRVSSDVQRPIVVKFGGGALTDLSLVVARVHAVRTEGAPVVLVVSARAGVTDRLQAVLRYPRDAARHRRTMDRIEAQHPRPKGSDASRFDRLRALVSQVERVRRADPSLESELLSQGERISAQWLSDRLVEAGVPATAVESDRLGLLVEDVQGAPGILIRRSTGPVRRGLVPILRSKRVPVVTGYFGRSPGGMVVTLGRGGSDYSASAIGSMLGAERIELVKRDAAVLTADPTAVPAARPLPSLSYDEAEELAQFGARVLHPMTIQPARESGIPLWVRSLSDPFSVTVIGAASGRRHRAFTRIGRLSLVTVRVAGGRERPGLLALTGNALAEVGVNVVTVFMSSALMSFVVGSGQGNKAARTLQGLGGLLTTGPTPVTLVTAIGDGILSDVPRIPPSVLVAAAGVSAGPLSVSIVVPADRGEADLRSLHQALIDPPSPFSAQRPVGRSSRRR